MHATATYVVARRFAALLAVALSLAMAGCERRPAPAMRGTMLTAPLEKPDVVFQDATGADYDLRARTQGKVALLFFGYTHCPDICPLHMANIAAVLRDLPFEKRSQVVVAFVTVDPVRDTPAHLRAWLSKFDPTFVALREKTAGDMAAVNRALMLPAAVTYPAEKGGYTVGHPAQVIAFEADGVARYVYPFGTRQEDWAHDLPILIGDRTAKMPAKGALDAAPPRQPQKAALQVRQVLIPEPPAGTAALYADIVNQGGDDVLLGIGTPVAKHAALHEMVTTQSGSMAMRHVEKIAIAGQQTTRLAPGGLHGMLMGVEGFARGTTVPVVFEFARAGRVAATAKVVGYEEIERIQAEGR